MKDVDSYEGMLKDIANVLSKVSVEKNIPLQEMKDECCIYGDDTCDTDLPHCEDLEDNVTRTQVAISTQAIEFF